MNWLAKKLYNLFTTSCPNCESAWTGGHPNPDKLEWCILCSHPETGVMRNRTWRWPFYHFTTTKNYQNFKTYQMMRDKIQANERARRC